VIALVVCSAILAGVLLAWRWHRSTGRLPAELKSATLIAAEKLFVKRVSDELEISARVDRMYRAASGQMMLVELKTRSAHRVYQSDVVELSAQRVAVAGQQVDDIAYVVTRVGTQERWHKVGLLPIEKMLDFATRREDLLHAHHLASKATNSNICRRCEFRKQCADLRSGC
jgi:CRISPR-associated exonuclease Cas4